MKSFLYKLCRTKSVNLVTSETSLNRCLGTIDLIVIGIGAMIGSGIYIMSGITAKEQTGPSIVLSFVVASLVVLLVAGCFTELAARLHKTGSTYLYIYLTVGELPAFVLGFSLLVSGVFSGSVNARAFSGYLDFMFHGHVSNFTKTHLAQWNIGPPIAEYPDVIAVTVIVLLSAVVALGVQCSAKFSALFVAINVGVLILVTICGFVFGDWDNWTSKDTGGLMPYGWSGVLSGAGTCFWAFSGFELISCAVEETRNPHRNIPVAMALTLLIVTTLYLGTAAGLTLMMPWNLIDTNAPLPSAFSYLSLDWGHYIVSIGPLCGFVTALLSSIFGFVRIALAMAEDGLLFMWFAKVNACTLVPVVSVLLCGFLQAVIAFAFEIRDMISFSVNLLLLSYSAVCVAVIVLRYKQPSVTDTEMVISLQVADGLTSDLSDDADGLLQLPLESKTDVSDKNTASHLDSRCHCLEPLVVCKGGKCVTVALVLMLLCMLVLSFTLIYGLVPLETGVWWTVTVVVLTALGICLFLCFICVHRQTLQDAALKLPCVPLIPSVAMLSCLILLVANSTSQGWIGCAVLLITAIILYFAYGIRNSRLNVKSYSRVEEDVEDITEDVKTYLLKDSDDEEVVEFEQNTKL